MEDNNDIKKIIEEMVEGDEEFKTELVDAYLQNLVEFKDSSKSSILSADVDSLKAEFHKIKPTLMSLGYEEAYNSLHMIGERFDKDLKDKYIKQITGVTEELIDSLKALV